MPWLRSPILYGILLLVLGAILRAAMTGPEPVGPRTVGDLLAIARFQSAERPAMKLELRYQPYAVAFMLAGSHDEIAAIKQRIDAELVARDEIRQRGLAGVPEIAAEKLAAVDLALMGLGAALLFRSLAFVLAVGFGAGVLHQFLAQVSTLTGAPSEVFLAAILAALAWSALFWGARAYYEGRLRPSR